MAQNNRRIPPKEMGRMRFYNLSQPTIKVAVAFYDENEKQAV